MKVLYIIGLIVGLVLLFATEAETAAINTIGLAMCAASAYKLNVFTSKI